MVRGMWIQGNQTAHQSGNGDGKRDANPEPAVFNDVQLSSLDCLLAGYFGCFLFGLTPKSASCLGNKCKSTRVAVV